MKFEESAGGVVYRIENGIVEVLLGQHSLHHGWVFPKGLIGDHIEGEEKEATAVREVKEETGIDAIIVEALKPVTYWYEMDGEKRKKTVYYYIMDYRGGNFEDRDFELENVRWVPVSSVMETLTYQSDKTVYKQAQPIIEKLAFGGVA